MRDDRILVVPQLVFTTRSDDVDPVLLGRGLGGGDLLGGLRPDHLAEEVGAARRVDPEGWRDLMEPARMAARRLVDRGDVEILQDGRVVDPSTAPDPIRVRRSRQ